MAVEITCNCDQMAYRRIKDGAGNAVQDAEIPFKRGDKPLMIEELQTIKLIDTGNGAHVIMKNVGTSAVKFEYVGHVDMNLEPGAKVYVDRDFTIRFFYGLPATAVVSDTQTSAPEKETMSYAGAAATASTPIVKELYTEVPRYIEGE